jgi:SAM-dependent methyltransferase
MKTSPPSAKFWLKTALYFLTPGGFGYYRQLRQRVDPGYFHERDKHPVREKHYGGGGWKEEAEGAILSRDYESYDEYLTHQRQKLDELLKIKGGFSNTDVLNYRLRFYSRFKHLRALLPHDAVIICAGARQGTEVEVLRDIGFTEAYGIDLNPGPENPLVRAGDFMHLDNENDSVDLLYTNCVDHAFHLEAFFAEQARVIKPDGYVLYDIGINIEEGGGPFEAVSWKRVEDVFQLALKRFKKLIRVERETQWMWVLLQGKN